jgi:hypothetical protein
MKITGLFLVSMVLVTAAGRALEAALEAGMRWHTEKDRDMPDRIRIEMVEMLTALRDTP